jgi:hypothetical protein
VFLVSDARRAAAPDLERYFSNRALVAAVAAGALAAAGLVFLHRDARYVFDGLTGDGLPLVILSLLCGIGVLVLLHLGIRRGARPLAIGAVAAVIWGWGVAQWPYLLPENLTISDAAAPSSTLTGVLVVFGIAVLVVLPSLGLLFTLVQRNLVEGDIAADASTVGRPTAERRARRARATDSGGGPMSTATEIVTAATSASAAPRNSGLVLLSLIRPVAVLVRCGSESGALWQLGHRKWRSGSTPERELRRENGSEMFPASITRELQATKLCRRGLDPRARRRHCRFLDRQGRVLLRGAGKDNERRSEARSAICCSRCTDVTRPRSLLLQLVPPAWPGSPGWGRTSEISHGWRNPFCRRPDGRANRTRDGGCSWMVYLGG